MSKKAEWPKEILLGAEGESVQVIRADLGRELYDALLDAGFKSESKFTAFHYGPIAKALLRYEDEVGT